MDKHAADSKHDWSRMLSEAFGNFDWRIDYPYKPLSHDKKEIRLLRFASNSHNSKEAPIRCKIEHVYLSDVPNATYNAISYCWGRNPKSKMVILDGVEVLVPESAEAALRRTYPVTPVQDMIVDTYKPTVGTCPLVWIDAICINQDDLTEKSLQIAIMNDIFSQAAHVLIWLGEIDATASPNSKMEDSLRKYAETLPEFGIDLVENCHWNVFCSLFNAEWFTRLWVVQEVVLAQHGVVIYDNFTVPWLIVQGFASWTTENTTAVESRAGTGLLNAGEIGQIGYVKGDSDILSMPFTPSFKTSEPRDGVYALIGLMKKYLSFTIIQSIEVDYAKPVAQVFADIAAMLMICHLDRGLDLIFKNIATSDTAHHDTDDATANKFPSWVPRIGLSRVDAQILGPCFDIRHHSASKDKERRVDYLTLGDWTTLRIQGILVDEIASVEDPPGELHEEWLYRFVKRAMEAVYDKDQSSYINAARLRTRLIQADYRGLQEGYPASHLSDFTGFVLSVLKNVPREGWPAATKLFEDIQDAERPDALKHAETLWKRIMKVRNFIITTGNRICTTSSTAARGDTICILLGSNVPVVMRREGNHWKLRGRACVYGIMNGEYIQKLRVEGRLQTEIQWFSIR